MQWLYMAIIVKLWVLYETLPTQSSLSCCQLRLWGGWYTFWTSFFCTFLHVQSIGMTPHLLSVYCKNFREKLLYSVTKSFLRLCDFSKPQLHYYMQTEDKKQWRTFLLQANQIDSISTLTTHPKVQKKNI